LDSEIKKFASKEKKSKIKNQKSEITPRGCFEWAFKVK
jgi:hypothetical protein